MIRNKSQWVIADSNGREREGAFETPIEAAVALRMLEQSSHKTQHEAEWRKQIGHQHYTDDMDLEAVRRFEEKGYRVVEKPLDYHVYRLNAAIDEDANFLREVLWKLRVCGEVTIDWTCIGHTRSEWQGESTAAFLSKNGYDAKCWSGGAVIVKAKKAVR